MSSISYSPTTPVDRLWIHDDGLSLRFYFSETTVARALVGEMIMFDPPGLPASFGERRPTSVQRFDASGITDITAVLRGLTYPDLSADYQSPEYLAFYNGGKLNGPRAPWNAYVKRQTKLRGKLVKEIAEHLAFVEKAAKDQQPQPTFTSAITDPKKK